MAKKMVMIDVVALGRAGGQARVANLSAEELSAASSNAARARWEQYYRDHPEKLAAKIARDERKGTPRGRPKSQPKKKAGTK